VEWAIEDGTTVKGDVVLMDGSLMDASQRNAPVSIDTYYIVPDKCTECQGFHEEPQCAAVCPVDCCIPDEMYRETVEELLAKKDKLHI
jgi:ferredoxin